MKHINMAAVLMTVLVTAFIDPLSACGCYGDIGAIDTTGASCYTASGDRLDYCGVRASETMSNTDLVHMEKYKTKIHNVGRKLCVDPALIAGIISRETRAGTGLINGWGDGGNAWGLMQVDKNWHTIVGDWDSEEHLTQATDILIYMIGEIRKKFPSWTMNQHLKGGTAAYNAGPGSVWSYENVDSGTFAGDYSNDVVARAVFYRRNGYMC
ncbi:lysozyme g-like [Ambystoma mexicanum]|uniref:lysozyme g-like n=1 Tax=Ambystoma mexicanum TaxID=8296 RepID=UPI0037E75C8D